MSNPTGLVIDFHCHFNDEFVGKQTLGKTVVTGFGTREPSRSKSGPRNRELSIPEVQIEDMDRDGVDRNVLTFSTVMQGTSWAPARQELELCRHANDTVAGWVAKFPKRFIPSFVLPLQDMRLAMGEFQRCVQELRMPIVQLPSAVKGAYLGEPPFKELWDAVYEKKLTALIHPEGATDMWYQKFRMWNSLGQSVEEAKVICSLIYEGVLERYPGIKIVISHGGGMLPYNMGRLDRNVYNMPDSTLNISKKPSAYLRELYYDSCVYQTPILERLIDVVGADRIVFGSDYPVGDPDRVGFVRSPRNASPEEIALMTGGTAAQLLGLSAQDSSYGARA